MLCQSALTRRRIRAAQDHFPPGTILELEPDFIPVCHSHVSAPSRRTPSRGCFVPVIALTRVLRITCLREYLGRRTSPWRLTVQGDVPLQIPLLERCDHRPRGESRSAGRCSRWRTRPPVSSAPPNWAHSTADELFECASGRRTPSFSPTPLATADAFLGACRCPRPPLRVEAQSQELAQPIAQRREAPLTLRQRRVSGGRAVFDSPSEARSFRGAQRRPRAKRVLMMRAAGGGSASTPC